MDTSFETQTDNPSQPPKGLKTKLNEFAKRRPIIALLAVFVIFSVLIGGGLIAASQFKPAPKTSEAQPANKYLAFADEVRAKIMETYWEKISDQDLTNLFVLATEKVTETPITPPIPQTWEEFAPQLANLLAAKSEEEKATMVTTIADVVLANLEPFGRSRLYSQQDETALNNRVSNINPEQDRYQILGVSKDATGEEIQKSYEQKTEELKNQSGEEARQQLAEIQKSYEILTDQNSRSVYDQYGAEPTVVGRLLLPEIFYLHIKQFSPLTLDEIVKAANKVDEGDKLHVLILDLRDNFGGAIDGLPYFLGPFIGNDQYAYQFYVRGDKIDFKTKTGWLESLIRYKKVVILINENSQSTAELMAAALKKYNVGITVGTTTRGWGTVERVFELEHQLDNGQKYSMFLVHSVTLRDDGQPIEGRGVEPLININDKNWEKQLNEYFNYPPLTREIKKLFGK